MKEQLCQACLSEDRKLVPLIKLRNFLEQTNIFMHGDLQRKGVCWECHRNMVKFTKFKLQVINVQNILSDNIQNPTCFSRLTKESKCSYDYEYLNSDNDSGLKDKEDCIGYYQDNGGNESSNELTKNYDCDVNVNVDIDDNKNKHQDFIDSVDDSNEIDCNEIENSKFVINEIIINDLMTNTSDVKNPKACKSKSVSKKSTEIKIAEIIKEDELKMKFHIKSFSIEEMMRNRDRKRSHPNFKKIPYKCDTCVLGFNRKDTFDLHIETKHNENIGPYTCDVCSVRFSKKAPLARHCKKHFSCYKCKFCKYETIELWSALKHCKMKHFDDREDCIHCKECPAIVRNKDELFAHLESQHPLHCNICREIFKSKSSLRKHKLRIHRQKRDFICEICSKTFMTKSRLETHASTHSKSLAQKLAFCAVCRIQYKDIRVYRNHLRNSVAHADDAYSCPECNKKFASKVYGLKHYNFYHLKKSKFHCETCNKIFISDWQLKHHRQKYHGAYRPRDHECNICEKRFYTVQVLRAHILTHSTERSFMCEACGARFKQAAALHTHRQLLHTEHKR